MSYEDDVVALRANLDQLSATLTKMMIPFLGNINDIMRTAGLEEIMRTEIIIKLSDIFVQLPNDNTYDVQEG